MTGLQFDSTRVQQLGLFLSWASHMNIESLVLVVLSLVYASVLSEVALLVLTPEFRISLIKINRSKRATMTVVAECLTFNTDASLVIRIET